MKLRLLAASLAAVGMMASASHAEVEIGAEYFDLYAAGDTIADMAAKGEASGGSGPEGAYTLLGEWSSGVNDLSAIAGETDSLYLALDTEGDVVTNAFADAETINKALSAPAELSNEDVIATGEVTLVANISFVPSDEIEDSLPDGTDADNIDNGDLKFALYAYEHEVTESVDDGEGNLTDVTSLVTNLVVYHSFYKDVGAEDPVLVYTNEVIDATIRFDEAKDVYITMRRVDAELFFKVNIDGDITSPLACAASALTDPIAYPSEGGVWFRTVNAGGSEDVSSINFSGTGSVGSLSATYATEAAGSTYSVSWADSARVVVSNATEEIVATTGEFEAGTVLTFYPTVGAITNVMLNGVEVANPATPYVYTVTTDAAQVLKVLAGEEPVPAPTIITVTQAIGGHGGSVSNGNFQAEAGVPTPITITADQGYVVAQIVTNGFPVADALGETSVTFDAVFSDADGANNSIVATFAKDNAWFVDPFIRNEFTTTLGTEGVQAAALDEANGVAVFGRAPGYSTAGQVSYTLSDLTNDFGKVTTPISAYAQGTESANDHSEYWGRSIAAIPSFGATICCNYQRSDALVFPYGGPWFGEDDASYTVSFDMGESGLAVPHLYPVAVNKAGTFLYGTDKAGARIYKFAITADAQDATKIGSLDYVASWEFTGGSDLKGIGVGTFNGNDVIYMAKNASSGLWTLDVASGTLAKTGAAIDCEVYDIIVTGQAGGTPRLVVAGGPRLSVYDLAADGSLLVDSPVFKDAVTSLFSQFTPVGGNPATTEKARLGVVAVDDETRIVLGTSISTKVTLSVVECKPANLIVRGTFDQGVTTDDRSVAFGAAASETFTAPAGETLISVSVNGVAQQVAEGATSFTYEAAELTEYVYIDMQSSPPVYTATWTGSQNVIVTNAYKGSSYEMRSDIFSTDALQGTVLSFYPTEGNVITNVTIGGVVQTGFDPACYSITVVSDTNLVVYAGETAQPAQKPDWATDTGDGSATDKYWAWAEDHAAGQNLYAEGADYSAQYLLNVDANVTPKPTLHIDSIEITDEGTKIVVSAAAGNAAIDLEDINGVLDVSVGNALGSLTKKAIPAKNLDFDANGRAEVIIPAQDGKFVKAGVDYSAPSASITEISE